MDLRVIVMSADPDVSTLVRAQVENLGFRCTVASTHGEATTALGWADALIVDMAGDGVTNLHLSLLEAPTIQVLAIVQDVDQELEAREAGVTTVLREPFAISDLVERVRSLTVRPGPTVIDLTDAALGAEAQPWWATH